MATETKTIEIPKELQNLPKKMVLLGGGQFFNQFIIVNVLEVHEVAHPLRAEADNGIKVLQAKVEERGYSGIEIFEPYLWSYHLHELTEKYADAPLDTYLSDFNGMAQGRHTKYILKG